MNARRHFATLAVLLFLCDAAHGGGGGENMLLVVNPNDPSALQIANAYAALRDIPANNILFLAPPPDYLNSSGAPQPIAQAEVVSDYLTPIATAISSRDLTGQINYIGTIGEADSYSISANGALVYTTANSLNYALSLLTPLTDGSGLTLPGATSSTDPGGGGFEGPSSALYQYPANIPVGSNAAIQHSASYSVYYPVANQTYATQYYMSGAIGYTGTNGNTAAQVIASLRSAAAADGTRLAGVFYFENSGDPVRSGVQVPEWSATESQLTVRGIPWIQENSTTPVNRSAVLGAICGAATLPLPNGSTYLPGSWAGNLTSYGCDFAMPSQTKATAFIAAGAAATTGAVVEPYNFTQRFANSSIDTFIADGSTLGEALAKSVQTPDVQMPLGDMLSQPFADVPRVSMTTAPGNYGAVRGTVSIGGSATLAAPRIATGIAELELLVDGLVSTSDTLAGGSGTFSLNTTGLSDGVHEVRIVAVNNAEAASEGYAAEPIVVNNHGRSISYNGGNTTFSSSTASPTTFNLAETAGDGAISQVELTCLGRVVAQAGAAAGSLSLSPSALAPGDNAIVPVAVFSDGTQVAGGAFVVHVAGSPLNTWTNSTNWALWSLPGDWSGGVTPQNGDGVARFGGTSGGTVTLDVSPTVQEVDFSGSGSGSYTLIAAPGQTLTMSTSSGPLGESLINVLSGTHTISAPVVLAAPGNLLNVTNPADVLTIGGGISGAGALTKTGSGTLIFTGSNTYTGTTTISGGTLQLGGAPAQWVGETLGSAAVVDNSVLQVNCPYTITLANSIGGPGAVSQSGPGTLVLTGTNSYSGGTQVSAGNVVFASTSAIPASGTILVTQSGALNVAGAYSTVTGWLNSGKINPASNGVLAISGTSSESINMAGYATLGLGATAPGATYSGVLTPAGSTFYLGGGGGNLTFTSNLTGARSVVIGPGSGTVVLTGSNSYTGGTRIVGGNVLFRTPSALPASGSILVDGPGVLNVTGAYSTVAAWLSSGKVSTASDGLLALTGLSNQSISLSAYPELGLGAMPGGATYSGVLTPGGGTYDFGGGGGTLTVASNLSGASGLVIGNGGPSAVVLSGSNTYTGGTTLSGGTLTVLNSWSEAGGNVSVGSELGIFDPVTPALTSEANDNPPAGSSSGSNAVPEPGTLLLLLAACAGGIATRWAARRVRAGVPPIGGITG
jgi:autotransporter-associated beta strand protein